MALGRAARAILEGLAETPKPRKIQGLFGEVTGVVEQAKNIKVTPEQIIQRYGLTEEPTISGSAAAAFQKQYNKMIEGLAPEDVAKATQDYIDIGGLRSVDDVVDVLNTQGDEAWRAMQVQQRVAKAQDFLLDSIEPEVTEEGVLKFMWRSKALQNDRGISTAKKFTEMRQAEAAKYDPTNTSVLPTIFDERDAKNVSSAYNWAQRHYHKFARLFRPSDKITRRAEIAASPYRHHFKDPLLIPKADGGVFALHHPIRLESWIRAADALSHDFNASEIYHYLNSLEVAPEFQEVFDPFDPKKWAQLKAEYIEPRLAMLEQDGISLSEIQSEGKSLEDLLVYRSTAVEGKVVQSTEEDLQLVRAYNQANQFMVGSGS